MNRKFNSLIVLGSVFMSSMTVKSAEVVNIPQFSCIGDKAYAPANSAIHGKTQTLSTLKEYAFPAPIGQNIISEKGASLNMRNSQNNQIFAKPISAKNQNNMLYLEKQANKAYSLSSKINSVFSSIWKKIVSLKNILRSWWPF